MVNLTILKPINAQVTQNTRTTLRQHQRLTGTTSRPSKGREDVASRKSSLFTRNYIT